ncbi:MAG: hypothetical protein Q4A05_07215, partial [Ruminococcus sp.]|nr:hypothetical protein [Ruminococcus sp.]
PVKKSTVAKLMELGSSEPNPRSSDESVKRSSDMSSINSPVELPDGTTMTLSDEQKQQLTDLLDSIKIDPFVNSAMEQMIKEESDYVFEGERSAEQCADILQSRIGLYLSETE